MRILQNQDKFATEPYRSYVTPLIEALLNAGYPQWIKRVKRNGFCAGLLMYMIAKKFDVIVTVGHRCTFTFGLLNRLWPKKGKVHVAKEFYFEERAGLTIRGKLVDPFYRFSFKNLSAVIVNASGEVKAYARALSLPESTFHFIPWPSNIERLERIEKQGDYVLAAGRSLRDWRTFFKAVEGHQEKFIVIASHSDVRDLETPGNVDVYTDVPYDKYIEVLRGCKFAVIPLVETQRSTGQSCFLEAMSFGKAVIVANVVGAVDYIVSGSNGLLYETGNAMSLRREIVRLLVDPELRHRLAEGGLSSIRERFNKNAYAEQMVCLMKELVNKEEYCFNGQRR